MHFITYYTEFTNFLRDIDIAIASIISIILKTLNTLMTNALEYELQMSIDKLNSSIIAVIRNIILYLSKVKRTFDT